MTPQLYSASRQVFRFIAKHHSVLFLSFVGLFMAVSIYIMYQVTDSTFAAPTNTTSTIPGFDQKTIDQIKKLNGNNNGNVTVQLPASRPNPFAE